MTKREKLGWIVVICALASAVLAFYFLRPKSNHRLEEVTRDVQANIRVGMNRSEVESLLTQRGIEHSYHSGVDKDGNPNMTRTEAGMIRGKPDLAIIRTDIQLLFRFDESEKLTSYSIREVFTGP
jgi:hypothetical protein